MRNPGVDLGARIAENSDFTDQIIWVKEVLIWLGETQKIGGMIDRQMAAASQFNLKEAQDWGSKVEKRLVI